MRWLLLESYYDGSHRSLVDGLRRHVVPEALLWTLPARKWKWRMRGASLEFARRFREERPDVDALFVTSLTNAAELRGLLAQTGCTLPMTFYMHENQLTYPVQHFDKRDHHFAWTNVHSCLAADRLLFNSRYNLTSFLDAFEALLKKMPDAAPRWAHAAIAEKAEVLPVPIDVPTIEPRRSDICHIVWNHRWEFDKGPERLMLAARTLVDRGLDFRMSVVGQGFDTRPAVFDEVRKVLGDRCSRWGFVEDPAEYFELLASADVVLSTATHEFQGLAVIEAASCGAVPLVPFDLAYPEIWPTEWCYRDDSEMTRLLVERITDRTRWRDVDPRPRARPFQWSALRERWTSVLSRV